MHLAEFVEDIDYSQYSNKQLLAIPAIIFTLAIVVLLGSHLLTGFPVGLGFQFTGGVSLQLITDQPVDSIESDFSGVQGVPDPVNVQGTATGAIVNFEPLTEQQLTNLRDYRDSDYPEATIETVSPAYGSSLLYQALVAVGFAFILMSLSVFAFFRSFIPSFAVVASATSDMIIPVGLMTLVGIDVSIATIPAILLIIGYSIDSDILLTRNTLQGRKSKFYENVENAMKTGVTMTTTSIAAMVVMAIAAHFLSVFILRDIGIILFVGLTMDLINTYMMNIAVLRWYIMGGGEV